MRWWNRKRDLEKQFDGELRFHIDKLTEDYVAAGDAPEEARRKAILEFGGREQMKEELRDVHRIPFVETALASVKLAFRLIRKSPSFSLTVILTLALGIGANSAVFSAIDAILLRPLPYPNADRLVRIHQYNYKIKNPETNVSPARVEDWNKMNSTFQSIAGYYAEDVSEISGALPEKVKWSPVSPRFLEVWGVSPALGRDFSADELKTGGGGAVLISDDFWRRRFGADPNALGRRLRVRERGFSIVGIMPASFLFPVRDVDIWLPVPTDAAITHDFRDARWYTVIGRLKPGVTLSQAQADLARVQANLGKAYPKTDADLAVGMQSLKEFTVAGAGRSLWLAFGSVSLLLLLACTNIAALLLARGAQRQQEISIRYSLGASRASVVVQFLTEVFVLAVLGTGFGLFIAGAASGVFRSLAGDLPRVDEIHLDTRIVLYSLICSVFATILCGLIPAVRGTRRSISGALGESGRTQVSSRNPVQWSLVGIQVALAVTLLAGAGLLVRSLQALGRVAPGFDSSHILTLHISGSYAETSDMNVLAQRIDRTLEILKAVAGVEGTAVSTFLPGLPNSYPGELRILEGRAESEPKIIAEGRFVSPSFFATMKIPVLAGQICHNQTSVGGQLVTPGSAVVNRSFVNTYFNGSAPIGYHLQPPAPTFIQAAEIQGVVGDVREKGLSSEPVPAVYWCSSSGLPDPVYLIRTHGDPMSMAETLRRKIHEIEPARAVSAISPLEEHLTNSVAENRLRAILLGFFAITAILLACVGLYGTLSYFANIRRREVGLRLALGALRSQIVRHFLWQGVAVSLLGCAVGLGLAVALGRFLAGMLFGVAPSDISTLVSVTLLVLSVAGLSSLFPAVRASRVEPMQVLRDE